MGEFFLAREHLESALSIYDPERHRTLALRYLGVDAGVYCLSGATVALWQLGYSDQVLKRSNEALVLAQRLPIPLIWLMRSCLSAFCANICGRHAQLKRTRRG
jgi:hypothetical protein